MEPLLSHLNAIKDKWSNSHGGINMHTFHFIKVGVIESTKYYPVAQVFAICFRPFSHILFH